MLLTCPIDIGVNNSNQIENIDILSCHPDFISFLFQLCARGKNKKEKFGGFISALTKKADETLILSGQKVCYLTNIIYIKFC